MPECRQSSGEPYTSRNLEMDTQVGEAVYDEQAGRGHRGSNFLVLEDPRVTVRDEDSINASFQRRVDVRLWTVANHPGRVAGQIVF